MELTQYLWAFLLMGFLLSLLAEYRIHISNAKYLLHHGATIRVSRYLEWFYRAQTLIIMAAFLEHVYFGGSQKGLMGQGLGILFLGFLLRQWAIMKQGRLWTRHFVFFRDKLVEHGVGRFLLQRVDLIAKNIEVIGLCLLLHSYGALVLAVTLLPPLWWVAMKKSSQWALGQPPHFQSIIDD